MEMSAQVCRPGAWGTRNDVFDRLAGAWRLDREIPGSAWMRGSATFRRLSDGRLEYAEQGRVRLPDGSVFDGSRRYGFERADGGFAVYFAPGPPRLFHRIEIVDDGAELVGTASHLCAADTYHSRYAFRPDGSFLVEHVVRGPRKDYVSRTVFTRAVA